MFCTLSRHLFLAVFFGFLVNLSLLQADHAEEMMGAWLSDDPRFARLEIRVVDGTTRVQAYRRCDEGYCPWSEAHLQGVANMSSQPANPTVRYQAQFHLASGPVNMTFRPEGQYLSVKVSAQTFGIDGPQQQESWLTFRRSPQASERLESEVSRGVIQGQATGPARSTASLFHVTLYGPSQPKRFVATQSLHQGYRFEGLSEGIYWLAIEPRGETTIEPSTTWQLIRVEEGQPVSFDIPLR